MGAQAPPPRSRRRVILGRTVRWRRDCAEAGQCGHAAREAGGGDAAAGAAASKARSHGLPRLKTSSPREQRVRHRTAARRPEDFCPRAGHPAKERFWTPGRRLLPPGTKSRGWRAVEPASPGGPSSLSRFPPRASTPRSKDSAAPTPVSPPLSSPNTHNPSKKKKKPSSGREPFYGASASLRRTQERSLPGETGLRVRGIATPRFLRPRRTGVQAPDGEQQQSPA